MSELLTPEDELGLLYEIAETPFGLGEPEDYEWNRAQPPGTSRILDQVVELESKGYAEIATGWDEGERRPYVYANITNAGRKRISELQEAGVNASAHYAELSFNEEGLSPDDREET
jgi:hypothetical protein